jgi:hypothetical protein
VNSALFTHYAEAPCLLLNSKSAAAALAISERSLFSLTQPRGDLPFVKIGRAKRWDLRDLLVMIDRLKVTDNTRAGSSGDNRVPPSKNMGSDESKNGN